MRYEKLMPSMIYSNISALYVVGMKCDNLYRGDRWQKVSPYNNKQPHFLHANTRAWIPKGTGATK